MSAAYRILVICIHNSARSQMAEELIRRECGDRCHVESAGLEPGGLNPLAVTALREVGIDISGKSTRSVFDLLERGDTFDTVITVCDETSAERCPTFPGAVERIHWGFPDPSALTGTDEERLAGTRVIRDQIARRIDEWYGSERCCVRADGPAS